MYLVISTSLSPISRTRALAALILDLLSEMSPQVSAIDLARYSLPLCDGSSTQNHPDVQNLTDMIHQAFGIILATPIYSFDVAPAARNLVQLTGDSWTRKVVGFACVAGGPISYTSVLSLANSLMLDYRSFVLPDFVFATSTAFSEDGQLMDEEVEDCAERLARTMVRVTEALKTA